MKMLLVQPKTKSASAKLKAVEGGEKQRGEFITKSGRPRAVAMIDLDTLEEFYCPYIGLYRLGGDNPKRLLKFKTAKEAKAVADKYFVEWGGKLA